MALILNTIFKSDIFVATKYAKVRIDSEPLETSFGPTSVRGQNMNFSFKVIF